MVAGRKRPAQSGTTTAPAGGELVIYRAPDGQVSLDVRLVRDSILLSQRQMAELFDKDTDTIGFHIRNIFDEGELDEKSTTEESSVVQTEGKRRVRRKVRLYNLDVAISAGYRVNSKRGTQFRIWATNVLRDHIIKGYTINESRLNQLKQAVRLVADVAQRRDLTGDEAKGLLRVVGDYSQALELLDDYDHQRVQIQDVSVGRAKPVTLAEVKRIVTRLRTTFAASSLFGQCNDASLSGAVGAVTQTVDRKDVYPSLEEKAANLLYLLVKNHPFVDGNKRIAAAVFLWFLEKNQALYRADGSKRVADNALVAMTLLIAESKAREKDILTRVLVNLINRRNI